MSRYRGHDLWFVVPVLYTLFDQLQEGQFEAAMCTEEGMAYALEQRKRIQELLLKYPYQHMHINYF